ncbi:MAG TPA: hypothetical protein VID28_13535 [Methylomirabilota bacterium]|jgi:hypothetical protein
MRRWLAVVALLLVGPLFALTPLAQATPQDPTWIAGIYDGADYDDVVFLITTDGGVAPSVPCQVFRGVEVAAMPARAVALIPTAPPSTLQSRAPPA